MGKSHKNCWNYPINLRIEQKQNDNDNNNNKWFYSTKYTDKHFIFPTGSMVDWMVMPIMGIEHFIVIPKPTVVIQQQIHYYICRIRVFSNCLWKSIKKILSIFYSSWISFFLYEFCKFKKFGRIGLLLNLMTFWCIVVLWFFSMKNLKRYNFLASRHKKNVWDQFQSPFFVNDLTLYRMSMTN